MHCYLNTSMNFHCYSLTDILIVDLCYYLTIIGLSLVLLIILGLGISAMNIVIRVVTCFSGGLSIFECLDYFFMWRNPNLSAGSTCLQVDTGYLQLALPRIPLFIR